MQFGELYDVHIAATYDVDALGLLRGGRELALQQLSLHARSSVEAHGSAREQNDDDVVVVDLSLGTGESVLGLAPILPQAQLHGMDISARMIELARAKLPEMHAIHDDAARVAQHFAPGSVDIALMHFLTTYIDAQAVIGEVARTLKPGGLLSLVSTTYESFPAIHALALRVLSADVVKDLNPAPEGGMALAEMMRAAGLEVIEQSSFEKAISFDNPGQLALWGMQSGFFTHVLSALPPARVQELSALTELFPLDDRYHAAALLARKPA